MSDRPIHDTEIDFNRARTLLADCESDLKRKEYERGERKDTFDKSQDYLHGYVSFPFAIDDDTVDSLLSLLRRMDRISPSQPFVIELYSGGGSISAGFRLFDELLRLRNDHHLTVRVRGEACSMAAVILQAAHKREIGPSSWVMLHRASLGAGGTVDEAEDAVQLVKRFESRIHDILAERTGKTAAWWKKELGRRKDQWYNPEQALKLGLADAIG